jgi:DNA-binding protein HU-beta
LFLSVVQANIRIIFEKYLKKNIFFLKKTIQFQINTLYLHAQKSNFYLFKLFIDMTKADIVSEIARGTGIDRSTVLASIETFMSVVKRSLANGENVYLRGFGSFVVKTRAKKIARNISKNTTIVIPEHNIPAFKPAKVFLSSVAK